MHGVNNKFQGVLMSETNIFKLSVMFTIYLNFTVLLNACFRNLTSVSQKGWRAPRHEEKILY